jgi:MoaA/NifB/PqqE/SkfB family radical SAM enzyme
MVEFVVNNDILVHYDEPMAESHPCFSEAASRKVGRVHLPVAPKCNIQCNFCNRKFDCTAESRPGVTSSVLTPEKALARLEFILKHQNNISVVGIAGPGDPLANPEETQKTFELVHAAHPELKLCLSTNGLLLDKYLPELLRAGLSHITITINSFTPDVASKIYSWVNYNGRKYFGTEAARILIEQQQKALKALEDSNIPCKINIVFMPGINDDDIPELVRELSGYSAVSCVNIVPFIPVFGSKFEDNTKPSRKELQALRNECEPKIPQIRHCCQCRSDAVGMINCNRTGQSSKLIEALNIYEHRAESILNGIVKGAKIAVASNDGIRVNEHFGHAAHFQIYEVNDDGIVLSENRELTPFCSAPENIKNSHHNDAITKISTIINTLSDCTIIICTKIGINPRRALESAGFYIFETEGEIKKVLSKIRCNLKKV